MKLERFSVTIRLVLSLLVLISIAPLLAQETPYCCAPPFIVNVVKPNVLIALDMTGSMQFRASMTINGGAYDPNRIYYGYFDPESLYYYRSGVFHKYRGVIPSNSQYYFPGNIMNYAIMSRIDVARKALTGGKGLPTVSVNKHTLQAESRNLGWPSSSYGWPFNFTYTIGGVTYQYRVVKPTLNRVYFERLGGFGPDTIPQGTFVCDIDVVGEADTAAGVIRQIADKDLDRDWDADSPRFALLFFSTEYGTHIEREFYMSDEDPDMEPFFTCFDQEPEGGTNVGNAVMQAVHYVRYCPPHSGSGSWNPSYTHHGPGTKWDPFFRGQGGSLVEVSCTKNFVVLIGDGESNSDYPLNIDIHLPPKIFPARPLYNYDGEWENYDDCSGWGDDDHCADDYAYFGHIHDLRDSSNMSYYLNDMQNITFYSLFTFGTGTGVDLFMEIAKDGGFIDDGDLIPEPEEYDKNGDSIPDNYYEAESGSEIEQAMKAILMDILAKISSSSGVAVVTAGSRTGGTTVQSQFYPRKNFGGKWLDWIGTCQSLWLDPFGLLREDTDHDIILDLKDDYVITLKWSGAQNNVMVTRYQDVLGNGDSLIQVGAPVPIENLEPVWDAGNRLWMYTPPANRDIWTYLNATKTDFNIANNALLRPYLGNPIETIEQADTIIRFIRGEDIDTLRLRSRTVSGEVWKLGDVINSGAILIRAPLERYDFIYGDISYAQYYKEYRNRAQVVYVGANDGLLHAFWAGQVDTAFHDSLSSLRLLDLGTPLGTELWGYVPYNLLPQLRWLTDPTYGQCHVYYVDLKPYVTDAQIFASDAVHPNGWGTLLVGGMRLGGTSILTDTLAGGEQDTCTSAYFAIDVTDPFNPQPLWEYTDQNLKYTVCYPIVVKVKNSWFLVFGSGPMTCGGDCSQPAKIYVINLNDGVLRRVFPVPDPNSFVTNIFACDWGIDYNVDRIYFGDCWFDGMNWRGKVYRILTHNEDDPALWTLNVSMDAGRPITGEGSVATDQYNHLWVYFGTGRLFADDDELNLTTEAYFGFRDDTTHSTLVTDLHNVTNYVIDTFGLVQPGNMVFDSLVTLVDNHMGWYREFAVPGEKSLTTSLVLGGAVLFTTFLPSSDICSYGGEGNLYALYYRTGTAYYDPFLGTDSLGNYRIFLSLGAGMPSEPSLYVSADQTKVFIQVGGGIESPETGIPGLPRGGVILWKGK